MPKTKLGNWSIGLIIAMPFLFLLGRFFIDLFYESVSSGDTILEDIAKRPALGLSMLAGMGSGVSAFVTGLIAIIKQKERALLVFVSTVLGALVVLFLIAEIVYPH
ncbi:hypothetical protein JW710_00910 [Candidatus Dojkabacteria bacterium]|nr:hypothetical protein [Candidatus Dojkabacteria bacterium]